MRLRDITPRGLLPRSLLIVVLPMALVQVLVTYVFFDLHWRDVSGRLSEGVAGDVAMILELYEANPGGFEAIAETAWATTRLSVRLREDERLPTSVRRSVFSALDQTLNRALNASLDRPYWFDTTRYPDFVDIRVQVGDDVLRALAYRERAFVTTGHIFLLWTVGATALLALIAILFLRNQIRPILRLAGAAERIGRGEPVEQFRPSGAREVRQAAASVLEMRDRLTRHNEQRTALLASVSHDLRTPLTRLKLQLALLPASDDTRAAKRDLDLMQAMLDEYLAFARGAEGEKPESADLVALARSAAADFTGEAGRIALDLPQALPVTIRPLALRRAVANLIGNALDHAKAVRISGETGGGLATLLIDDDGPGIPEDRREEAFKPFGRLDEARNQNRSGVGLGLAIARDAARGAGGDLTLDVSPMGGLRARLSLPARSEEG